MDWFGAFGGDAQPDILNVTLASTLPPFGATIADLTNIDLAAAMGASGCGACVTMVLNVPPDNPMNVTFLQQGPAYIATSGILNVTQVPTFPATPASRISGTIANASFEHVNVDPTTNVLSFVGDGCKFTITSAVFDAPITPP